MSYKQDETSDDAPPAYTSLPPSAEGTADVTGCGKGFPPPPTLPPPPGGPGPTTIPWFPPLPITTLEKSHDGGGGTALRPVSPNPVVPVISSAQFPSGHVSVSAHPAEKPPPLPPRPVPLPELPAFTDHVVSSPSSLGPPLPPRSATAKADGPVDEALCYPPPPLPTRPAAIGSENLTPATPAVHPPPPPRPVLPESQSTTFAKSSPQPLPTLSLNDSDGAGLVHASTAPPTTDRPASANGGIGEASFQPLPTAAAATDELHRSWGTRFAGNMLVSRGVRAAVTSTSSSIKLPLYLSPWG